ncbi:MAG: hypothetical protein ABL982_03770 [Vicinamibacterales bacterium]
MLIADCCLEFPTSGASFYGNLTQPAGCFQHGRRFFLAAGCASGVHRRADWLAVAGAVLLAIIWASTALLQVPAHNRLERGFDADVHRRLVRTNWIRTVCWTARVVVALTMWLQTVGYP